MEKLFKLIQKDKRHKRIIKDLLSGKDCHVHGLWGSSAAFLIASLAGNRSLLRKGEILFITPTIECAEEVFEDINIFLPGNAVFFPVSEDAFFVESKLDNNTHVQQLNILHKLLINKESSISSNQIFVTPIQALLQRVPSPEAIEKKYFNNQGRAGT